jgi:hypothetical protein
VNEVEKRVSPAAKPTRSGNSTCEARRCSYSEIYVKKMFSILNILCQEMFYI